MRVMYTLGGALIVAGFVLTVGAKAREERERNFVVWSFPGARFTGAQGINSHNDVVGTEDGHAFLLSHGRFTTFDYPGATITNASGINDRGDIVGLSSPPRANSQAFLLRRGVFTPILCLGTNPLAAEGINNDRDIVGARVGPNNITQGYLLKRSGACETIEYPGASFTDAAAINDRGDIAGTYGLPDSVHGFVLRDGVFTSIDYPHGSFTEINGINDRGDLIGTYSATRAFLFDAATGLFMTLDGSHSDSLAPAGINDWGDIVGRYSSPNNPNGYQSFSLKGLHRPESEPRVLRKRGDDIVEREKDLQGFFQQEGKPLPPSDGLKLPKLP